LYLSGIIKAVCQQNLPFGASGIVFIHANPYFISREKLFEGGSGRPDDKKQGMPEVSPGSKLANPNYTRDKMYKKESL